MKRLAAGLLLAAFAQTTLGQGFGGGSGGGGGFGGGGSGGGYYHGGDVELGLFGPIIVVTLLAILLVMAVSIAATAPKLVELVFVYDGGQQTLESLDHICATQDYRTGHGRKQALLALWAYLSSKQPLEAQVRLWGKFATGAHRYGSRLKLLGIQEQRYRALMDLRRSMPSGNDSVCLVGFFVAVDKDFEVQTGGKVQAQAVLSRIGSITHPNELRIYYAPGPGQHLTLAQAEKYLREIAR